MIKQQRPLLSLLFLVALSTSFRIEEINTNKDFQLPSEAIYPQFYDVLAPFPKGFREIGSDVLEAFGGIRNIPRADNSTYPSDLYFEAAVGWTKINTDQNAQLTISFNNQTLVNWDLMTSWAGEVVTAFGGWALGDFNVNYTGNYLSTCNMPRYFIDTQIIHGDSYSLGLEFYPVFLTAGRHTYFIPVSGYQEAQFTCYLITPPSPIRVVNDNIFPDWISYNGVVNATSPYASIVVSNTDPVAKQTQLTIKTLDPNIVITEQYYPTLAPGQTAPLKFKIQVLPQFQNCSSQTYTTTFFISSKESVSSVGANVSFYCLQWPIYDNPYAFVYTFPDFDGSIQYSVARAPRFPCLPTQPSGCSIIFTFHGAGVASGPVWSGSYVQQNSSWILFPTNRRPYGFDWQGPGRVNAWSAFNYFVQNIPGVPEPLKNSFTPDANRIIYAGHSMGGHGCWDISTHYPDRALAVAPASGWIKMQFYFPYFTHLGSSLTNPFLSSILESAISENNADFYTQNIVGIPFITRFGSLDDNVPPYHMRRMTRLIDQLNRNPTFVEVSEVPGQGHWFDGVVDGPPMQAFFDKHALQMTLPTLPKSFKVVTMNPASSEGRGGIRILQLILPYRAAIIHVDRNGPVWTLRTENVRRFTFESIPTLEAPTTIIVRGQSFTTPKSPSHLLFDGQAWQLVSNNSWILTERSPLTYGPLFQIFERPVMVIWGTSGTSKETATHFQYALFIANNMWYQGRYFIPIYPDTEVPNDYQNYNLILLGGPETNSFTSKIQGILPVKFSGRIPSINSRQFQSAGTGVIFLSPGFLSDRLVAVVAGVDEAGFTNAISLLPMSSALMVPDYAVTGPDWKWAGSGGLLAAGFWDNNWKYNSNIGYVTEI